MIDSILRLPKVIFDTGIMFGATFVPTGVAAQALQVMVRGEVAVTVSNRLRSEYEQTVTHPGNFARFPSIPVEYAAAVLDLIDRYADRIPNPPRVFAYSRDWNDEPLINLAVAIKADYLVTLDNDLLALPDHPDFEKLPVGLKILKPGAFLIEMSRH